MKGTLAKYLILSCLLSVFSIGNAWGHAIGEANSNITPFEAKVQKEVSSNTILHAIAGIESNQHFTSELISEEFEEERKEDSEIGSLHASSLFSCSVPLFSPTRVWDIHPVDASDVFSVSYQFYSSKKFIYFGVFTI